MLNPFKGYYVMRSNTVIISRVNKIIVRYAFYTYHVI